MAKEIERKYLVDDMSFINQACGKRHIVQAYLSVNPDATVRVRIADDKAYLTVKSRNKGAVRNEWEYEIPVDDASQMIDTCAQSNIIDKTRYLVPAEHGLTWEIDVFHGQHTGLVVAEIELPEPAYRISLPSFIGDEVTGDPKYYNSSLAGI